MQEPGVHRSNSSARDAGYALTISGLDKGLHQDVHKVSTRIWADTKVLFYLPDWASHWNKEHQRTSSCHKNHLVQNWSLFLARCIAYLSSQHPWLAKLMASMSHNSIMPPISCSPNSIQFYPILPLQPMIRTKFIPCFSCLDHSCRLAFSLSHVQKGPGWGQCVPMGFLGLGKAM